MIDSIPTSLRFKYGIHTFFLLVKPTETFYNISQELIEALRDREMPILATETMPPSPTHAIDPLTGEEAVFQPVDPVPVPNKDDDDVRVQYGVLKDIYHVDKGFNNLHIKPNDTPLGKGFKNNDVLAFVIHKADEAPPEFNVKPSKWEDDDDEEKAVDNNEEDEQSQTQAPKSRAAKGKGKGKGKQTAVSRGDDVDAVMDDPDDDEDEDN